MKSFFVGVCFVTGFLLFGYGVVVGKYQFPPYNSLIKFKALFAGVLSDQVNRQQTVVTSSLLEFDVEILNAVNSLGLAGYGGGLAKLNDEYTIGIDREGHFFLIQLGGGIQLLDSNLVNNEGLFLREVEQANEKLNEPSYKTTRYFRYTDIATKSVNEQLSELFVAYHFWDPEKKCKRIKVSKSLISYEDITSGRYIIDNWMDVYVSASCLKFNETTLSDGNDPFRSNRSGGRLAFLSEHELLLSTGDFQYDGVDNANIIDNSENDFGKILYINLNSGERTVYAKGLRNPQGLHVDNLGSIWETEHGPQGGDELNLIVRDAHYGWPFHTYGTNYGTLEWPSISGVPEAQNLSEPLFAWTPSIAISSLLRVDNQIPLWNGDLLIGSLKAASLFRVKMLDNVPVLVEPIFIGERIRDLEILDSGEILLWTDNMRILKLKSKAKEFDVAGTGDLLNEGKTLYQRHCSQCHILQAGVENPNMINLSGILGRKSGMSSYSGYSRALQQQGLTWTKENLIGYIRDPSEIVPGTIMPSPSLSTKQTEKIVEYVINQ